MTKSLSSIWLKSIRRMGKTQHAHGLKLLESILPKVAPLRKARRPKLKLVKPVVARLRKKASEPRAAPVPAANALPGTWRRVWFSLRPAIGSLAPVRRMLYWLYTPSGPVVTPRPLVVMLHGCQQTVADFAAGSRMNELAERKGFSVLYPQQSVGTDSHRCWHWYKRSTQQGDGDVELIAAMISQVQRKHGLDATRTYVAGISAGAGLAAILALQHPDLIAAVGLHSAPVYGTADSPMNAYGVMQHGSSTSYADAARAFAQARPQFPGMPAIVIHGQRDSVVRAVNAEQLVGQLQIINAPQLAAGKSVAEPVIRRYAERRGGRRPRHAYQTATYYAGRKPQLVRCDIQTLGHAWSGGDASMKFHDAEGPDASLMMWSFFNFHRRNPALPVA